MSNYLVTGGAGFIGSHLVHRFLEDGHSVRVLDNLSTGRKARLDDVISQIEFIEGDLCSETDCTRAVSEIDVVFHEAALPSVPRSVEDPVAFHTNNIDGTFRLLLAARDAGCRRVVYAASSSAYGDQPELPKHERMLPRPESPYALNKLTGEHYASVFYKSYGLQTISLRYFNVFGPQQDPASEYAAAIPAFFRELLSGRQPVVYGDGLQTRDFTYIDNVVLANRLAAEAPHTHGECVNIATGESISINDVIATINRLLGTTIEPRYEPVRAGDVKHSLADIQLAKELIGYQPTVHFEDGLRRSLDWYRQNL